MLPPTVDQCEHIMHIFGALKWEKHKELQPCLQPLGGAPELQVGR